MKWKKRKSKSKAQQEISTASLPDIVFMLLFFFMSVTVMRTMDPLFEVALPSDPNNTNLKNSEQPTSVRLTMESSKVTLAVNEKPCNINLLTQRLRSIDHPEDKPILFYADKDVPIQWIKEVEHSCREAETYQLFFLTNEVQ